MKTLIKTASTAVKRAVVYFQMRSVEINLAGMIENRDQVSDISTRIAMAGSIRTASIELCRLRSEYIALRPRTSWRAA